MRFRAINDNTLIYALFVQKSQLYVIPGPTFICSKLPHTSTSKSDCKNDIVFFVMTVGRISVIYFS